MKLLIVEDDTSQTEMYKDQIDFFNKKNDNIISTHLIHSLEIAKEALLNEDFDGAIIDLKLSPGSTELEGLEIIDEIMSNLRFPIYIFSGSIGQIDEDKYKENAFLKKRSRDTLVTSILEELLSIYNTGITQILGRRGKINEYLSEIFWKHLSSSLDIWIENDSRTNEKKQKSLLRYTLLHIQEYLELTEESNFENYFSAEIYITPPIKDTVFTGDIVQDKSNRFVVLTPSCDLAQAKTKIVLLAKIEESNDSSSVICQKINSIKRLAKQAFSDPNPDLQKAENELKSIIKNSYSSKYHFLPEYKEISSGVINFQKINSIALQDFNKNYNRIATINSSFTKDIVARFSYYYSRQGSPDFNVDEIFSGLIKD